MTETTGLNFYTSNRLDALAAELAKVIAQPLNSPLEREVIVVQSAGMRRWLSFKIAELHGICANCEFPFPRTFLNEALREFVPELSEGEELATDVMAWKIHRLLPRLLKKKSFEPVANYLADQDGLKLFQLAEKIATLFDQYIVYRPEMIMRWERGDTRGLAGDEAWQAMLWREISGGEPFVHLAAARELIAERIAMGRKNQAAGGTSPTKRVSFFGISALPPLYLEFLFQLTGVREMHFFLLAPTSEYHGDDLTPKQRARRGITEPPTGHPLLISLGRLHAHFVETLLEAGERAGNRLIDRAEEFPEPRCDALLPALQRDILRARGASGEPDAEQKTPVALDDCSIQAHVCHCEMREVETLYDHVLDWLAHDPTLQPRDILVMTPDIEKYAPFIHAVFEYPEDPARKVPFSISDRHPRSESTIMETFFAILELHGSRCTAPEIFALLNAPPIKRRYTFTDEDLALIRRWIHESGIRWGVDSAHRKTLDLPALCENTWRHGLDRLLLGYAMPGGNRTLFEDILPHDEVEGASAEVLGRFISAVEAFFALVESARRKHSLRDWARIFTDALPGFFLDGEEDAKDLRELRDALQTLAKVAERADSEQPVEFTIARHYLVSLLGREEQRGGFLTGGVTFCALKPMRSIPSRIICLLGMSDEAFPRRAQPLEFDLMARERRLGDPSAREDDRYIFLEAIMAARERLYISHIGRSIIDNEEIPPSVVVSELLDCLDQSFAFTGGKTAHEFVRVEHRLHAFSARYFENDASAGDARLFSYSEANAAAARSLRMARHASPHFLRAPLPEPDASAREIELQRLIEFFANPSAFFLRHRLGIRLQDENDALDEAESLQLDHLAKYGARQELFEAQLRRDESCAPRMLAARGIIAPGRLGAMQFRSLARDAREFRDMVRQHIGDGAEKDDAALVRLQAGAFWLTGRVDSIYNGNTIHFRCAPLKPKDRLRAWIHHLARCASSAPSVGETILLGMDETTRFAPVPAPDAAGYLARLLEIYWSGHVRPAPFFPASAFAFAQAHVSSSDAPLEKARSDWHGGWNKDGEKAESHICFCFGEREPLDDEFAALALDVFEPMLKHANKIPASA